MVEQLFHHLSRVCGSSDRCLRMIFAALTRFEPETTLDAP